MHKQFRTIGLVGKFQDHSIGPHFRELASVVHRLGLSLVVESESTEHMVSSGLPYRVAVLKQLGQDCDLVIALGGDGTLLGAARSLCFSNVPLLGVNLGRLGFLAATTLDQIKSVLPGILDGDYLVDRRMLLLSQIWREGQCLFHDIPALNDVIVHKANFTRMIEFETHINDDFVYRQRSDGLIVSTPTGSTAYAMSAGGPIIEPGLGVILLVPICPHTLNNRPLVIADSAVLRICVNETRKNPAQVSFDGQRTIELHNADQIHIRRAACQATFLHPKGGSHYQLLRQKLHWAEQLVDS